MGLFTVFFFLGRGLSTKNRKRKTQGSFIVLPNEVAGLCRGGGRGVMYQCVHLLYLDQTPQASAAWNLCTMGDENSSHSNDPFKGTTFVSGGEFTSEPERCLTKNFIWFGYIARLSQWRRGGYLTLSNDFYLSSLRLGGGGGGWSVYPVELISIAYQESSAFISMCTLFSNINKGINKLRNQCWFRIRWQIAKKCTEKSYTYMYEYMQKTFSRR